MTIEIPARRNWFVIVFLSFWLCGWAVGELMVPIKFFAGSAPAPAKVFSLVWLGAWTVGGAAAITVLAWMLAGIEAITVTGDLLSIRRCVGRVGYTRAYDTAHLSRLRLESSAYNMFDPQMALAFYGLGGGRIAFDYGSATVRFGNRIDDPDAFKVIEACSKVMPKGVLASSNTPG